jgi:Flp pilus assembly CpaE family ATPase
VVVLTGYEDQSLALEAVRQGAQDYLAKFDATPYVLARTVRYAFERHHGAMARNRGSALRLGRVIGFVGAKGGVGATTLVINLGSLLASRGVSAVSAELRQDQGSFALWTRHKDPKSIRDVMAFAPEAIGRNSVASHLYAMPSGLKILYGPQEERLEIPSEKSAALIRSLSAIADISRERDRCLLGDGGGPM